MPARVDITKNSTGEFVYILDLCHQVALDPTIEHQIRKVPYYCSNDGCCVTYIPSVLVPKKNSPSPHFREFPSGQVHTCGIEKYRKYLADNPRGSFSCNGSIPCPYPSKLILGDESIESLPVMAKTNEKQDSKQNYSLGDKRINGLRDLRVDRIEPLVEHFIRFTKAEDRALPLSVPENNNSTYKDIFKKLNFENGYNKGFRHKDVRIYFSQIYRKKTDIFESKIVLSTCARDWNNQEENIGLRLSIEASEWQASDFKRFKSELEKCLSKKSVAPWVFFLGTQPQDKPLELQLYSNDSRVIHCTNSEILKKEYRGRNLTPITANFSRNMQPVAVHDFDEVEQGSSEEIVESDMSLNELEQSIQSDNFQMAQPVQPQEDVISNIPLKQVPTKPHRHPLYRQKVKPKNKFLKVIGNILKWLR